MRNFCYGILTIAAIAAAGPAWAQQTETPKTTPQADTGQSTAPAGASSYFINLKNGDTVISPFKVVFGLSSNMGVAPSGVEKANAGHHHVFIDTTLTAEEETQPITVDEHHVHFGKGQTETMLSLPPGKHTLQLMLGDWTHIPFKPLVKSEIITITVKAGTAADRAADAGLTNAKAMYHHRHRARHRH